MKQHSILGGILLIVGMSVGSGMLALPTTMAEHGFIGAVILLTLAWLVVTFSAFLILEANLRLPPNSNLISMAKQTLGVPGQIVAWISYLLLLYSLLSAMTAGGSDVLSGILTSAGLHTAHAVDVLLFVVILGFIVYLGIRTVDTINRGLMSVKFLALAITLVMIFPFVHPARLPHFYPTSITSTLAVVITAYGFSIVIPSLRDYYHSDVARLRKIVLWGSLIPLFCYLIWVGAVLGALPLKGVYSLNEILHSADPNTQLSLALNYYSHSEWIMIFTRTFAGICLATTFLGVALSLSDFLVDGLKKSKRGMEGVLVYSLTFIPPTLIVLIYPAIFVKALSYAGIFCTVLMILLPVLMVWRARYQQNLATEYQVMGGKLALILTFIAGLFVVALPLF